MKPNNRETNQFLEICFSTLVYPLRQNKVDIPALKRVVDYITLLHQFTHECGTVHGRRQVQHKKNIFSCLVHSVLLYDGVIDIDTSISLSSIFPHSCKKKGR